MKWKANVGLLILLLGMMSAGSQSTARPQASAQAKRVNEYWIDAATGLIWAGRDNGRDVNWHQAKAYCLKVRLAGYADWRLPTAGELTELYDRGANAPGLAGPGKGRPFTWLVKGNLVLTGDEWSITHGLGSAYYFDFNEGREDRADISVFDGRLFSTSARALCVRGAFRWGSPVSGK